MNKMYEYLKNHAYISYNKKSTYEFELSEERAECIANKYDSLTDELQQENKRLKMIIKEYERLDNGESRGCTITRVDEYDIYDLIKCKDNWNKLKEYLHNKIPTDKTVLTKHIKIFEVLDKMQEIEQGSDSNE